ncbi:MAG: primosomal protein N', partial [Clostridia bacterium]|nr:primosomal protein N' [Clostridia bacterium]
MCGAYVNVHIIDVPYHADNEYTYFVPEEKRELIKNGSAISVPFGNSDRQKLAIVVNCDVTEPPNSSNIKPVVSVMPNYFSIDETMINLCKFMKNTTLCTIGEAVKCIIPSALVFKTKEVFSVVDTVDDIPPELKDIYWYMENNPSVTLKKLSEKFENAEKDVSKLLKLKLVNKTTFVDEKDKSKFENHVTLNVSTEEAIDIVNGNGKIKLRGKKQGEILKLLCEHKMLTDKEIYEETKTTKQTLDGLVKKDLVCITQIEISRNPYSNIKKVDDQNLILSEEQQKAFDVLKELYHSNEPKGALLYGVTGSGKTSVMKKMIDEVVENGQGVILLVPEISLTPQTVSTFCGYYGDRVAVIHSSLSVGERFDTYKKIFDGKADIVVGTRSAIFAPVKNLGMIIIDEEQEHTYKSDTNPKYLAHDIARFRCAKSNALMVLASATPSLNSYYKALSGKYTLVKMTKRYGDAKLPDVIVTDMRKERQEGNVNALGTKLAKELAKAVDNDKQAILFLNRRGYHSSVSCLNCGKVIECPNCSVALTYHSYKKINTDVDKENKNQEMDQNGVLKCHYCGHRSKLPKECPECKKSDFNYIGFGTQKTEQDISELLPKAKILRLDADTTVTKASYDKILGDFRDKKSNVLIGTQMVTKGHNFPLVTVVGVVLADTMLYTSDYRASERTFSMLTQVIGRAGRAKDHGIAIVQTNSPNEQTIQLSARQDYESFYENEIKIRKAYSFPPFCDLAVITLSYVNEQALNKDADKLMKDLEREFKTGNYPVIAYGPFDAPVYKTQGRYRKRIIIKCKLNNKIRETFAKIYLEHAKNSKGNYISIDFNPSN